MGRFTWLLLIPALVLLTACGGGVSVTAHFIKGGSPSRATLARSVPSSPGRTNWSFSPDKGKVTFKRIDFTSDSGSFSSAELTDCVVTYDRTAASGGTLLDCPMKVPEGTYTQMAICFSASSEILISDSSVPLYTDANSSSLLSTSEPAGGATFVTPPATGVNGSDPCFTIPIPGGYTVSAASPATISIITDMTRSVSGTSSGSSYSFTASSSGRVFEVVGVPGSGGTSEYYSDASSLVLNGPTGEKYQKVYYDGNGKPVAIGGLGICDSNGPAFAYAYSPTAANALGFASGIYLGLDSGNTLAWAIPNTSDTTKASVFTMGRLTTLGGSTTIKCQDNVTPIPTPASGDTYESGAPTIGSPTSTVTYYLLTK